MLLICLISSLAIGQTKKTAIFGSPFPSEIHMTEYKSDPEASAVILFESGTYFIDVIDEEAMLFKIVHRKIKVLNASKYDNEYTQIPYLIDSNQQEEVLNVEAITHNDSIKKEVASEDFFFLYEGGDSAYLRFAFPDIKNGSVLEYMYVIKSPFFTNFGDWQFQGYLPKLYSEFTSIIPGYFQYNRVLYGKEKLSINKVSVLDNCISPASFRTIADCEETIYAMENIPAFKEEPFMLSGKNYIARVEYELREKVNFKGRKREVFENWINIDKTFRKKKEIGKQLKNTTYFKNKLPEFIRQTQDPIEKAKAIYTFIQNHFTWDQSYLLLRIDPKKAFQEGTGNVPEINISLINSLKAAGLDAKLMLLSTRDNGLPKRNVPTLTDFNYYAAFLTIEGVNYILDATDKQNPFGVVPIRALNRYGRVMDFKNGSYWYNIKPYDKNIFFTNAEITATEDGSFLGKVVQKHTGYFASGIRELLEIATVEEYIQDKFRMETFSEIENFELEGADQINDPFTERYDVTLEVEDIGDKTYLYPIFMTPYFSENPMPLDTRKYPIDFGFPFSNIYVVSVNLNNQYTVIDIPKSRIYKLPNDSGECSITYSNNSRNLTIRLSIKLKKVQFKPEEYTNLKEFFSNMIIMQSKEPIVLKKL
ncbi:MAG: hypothetical protein ACJAVA_002491 [Flavobacteriaceae bacterium]|jgi:hypothetical protein